MKRILSAILVFCLLCSAFSGITVFAQSEYETEEIGYIYENGVLTITGSGEMSNYDFWGPEAPWIEHAETATKVIINEGITSIGDCAFYDFIALKEAQIPEGIKHIGMHAFSGSGLSELNIPKSVETISEMPFVNCESMESYNVDPENPYFCSVDGVLFSKDKSVLISYPLASEELSYTISDEVVEVKGYAFSLANNLSQVTFGANVKSIGDECFFNCENLTSVSFNEGLEFIGGGAFQHCRGIDEFSLPSTITKIRPLAFWDTGFYNDLSNWHNDLLYIGDYLITCEYVLIDEESEVLEEIYAAGDITVKDGTKLIASDAFNWFNWEPEITSVSCPSSLKYINEFAFYGLEKITEITLGDSVEWIDEYAFYRCTKLSNVTLGNNIKRISECAFDDTAYVGNTANYENGFLYNNTYLLKYTGTLPKKFDVKDGTTLIADKALSNGGIYSSFSVKLPESLKFIGKDAFLGTKTAEIEIPEGVTEIGDYAIGFGSKRYDDDLSDYVYSTISGTLIKGYGKTAAYEYCEKFGIEYEDLNGPAEVIHNFEWVIDKKATCFEDGVSHEECTICGEKRSENTVIYATGSHTYDNDCDADCNVCGDTRLFAGHLYDSACDTSCNVCGEIREPQHSYYIQKSNSQGHWNECFCGARDESSYEPHSKIDAYDESHHWKECRLCGYIDFNTKAEHEVEGYFQLDDKQHCRSCSCGYYMFDTVENHTARYKASDMNYHWEICACGTIINRELHKYNHLKKNEYEHWNECECGKEEFDYRFGHGYSRNYDKDTHWLECYCGDIIDEEAHSFDYLKSDSKYHWKECSCGFATAKTAHTYKTETTKATTSKDGSIVKKCSGCSKSTKTAIKYAKTFKLSTTTYTYNGKVKTPTVTVKDSAGKTISSKNYTVSYSSGRKNVGTYKVTIKMKGNYSGTKTLTFKIVPRAASVNKLTVKKKAISVKLNRSLQQSTGYQIQYSTSKTFKGAKTKTVTSYKTSTTTLTGLKAKKTYYVRVRTYKTIGKTKYYSNWSTYKTKKTK